MNQTFDFMVSPGSKFKLDLKIFTAKIQTSLTAQKTLSLSGLLRSQYCTSNILTTLTKKKVWKYKGEKKLIHPTKAGDTY